MKKLRNVRGILAALALVLSIGMTVCVSEAAEENTGWVTVDGVDGGMIKIETLPEYDANAGKLAIVDAEESITKANIPEEINGVAVVEVSYEAFCDCILLESVTIPDSVTQIDSSAFWECTALSEVKLSSSITELLYGTFYHCISLKEIVISEGVTYIEYGVFENCENLTSVTLPSTIETIYSWQSFANCPDNLVIYTNKYSEYVDTYTSEEWIVYVVGTAPEVPYDAMEFGWMEVEGIEGGQIYFSLSGTKGTILDVESTITEMNIPDNIGGVPVESISGSLFDDSSNYILESLVIPDSVTKIGSHAFLYCRALETVSLGESVEWIGNNAFYGCTSLKTITIPSTVTRLGTDYFEAEYSETWGVSCASGVFGGCTSLVEIIVSEDNPVYASWEGMLFNKELSYLFICPGAKSGEVIIPDSVVYIDEAFAFSGCQNLTKITLNEGVANLPSFEGCEALEVLEISSSVIEILYGNSFEGVNSLKEIIVAEDNTAFSDLNGALYSSDYEILYKLPALLEETELLIQEETDEIWPYALENCYYLTTFSVEENNQTYMSIDGVLFSKDGETLIKYPCGNSATSYVVPEGTTVIETFSEGFCGSYNLVSVKIPSTITFDDYYNTWFFDCANLEKIEFAEGIETVESVTFFNCPSIQSVILPSTITYIDSSSFKVLADWGNYGYGGGTLIEGLTIYMYEDNEYVKTYAENKGFTYCLLDKNMGDVSGDDEMNVTDIMMIYKFINEVDNLTTEQQEAADVNGDGAVDVIDIMAMYKHINEVELLF